MKKIFVVIGLMILGLSLLSCGANTSADPAGLEPGVYYAVDDQTKISVYVVVNDAGVITDVTYDQPYQNTTKKSLGDELVLDSGHTWSNEVRFLESYLVTNQGWKDITFETISLTGMTALNAPDSFIDIDFDLTDADMSYFTLSFDGFVLAWNKAIQNASTTQEAVVTGIPSSEEWFNANKPPYELNDGVYYSSDIYRGYICRVEVVDGYIVDVIFDNITAVNTRIVWNDNNTPADESDDFPEVEIISMTTKQALGDDLVVSSGVAWYVQAEMMADAIVSHQGWSDLWTFTVSGNHEYLDQDVDTVAGVTIAIEGFRLLFDAAIEQALID